MNLSVWNESGTGQVWGTFDGFLLMPTPLWLFFQTSVAYLPVQGWGVADDLESDGHAAVGYGGCL